jgi:hypothetical protein
MGGIESIQVVRLKTEEDHLSVPNSLQSSAYKPEFRKKRDGRQVGARPDLLLFCCFPAA